MADLFASVSDEDAKILAAIAVLLIPYKIGVARHSGCQPEVVDRSLAHLQQQGLVRRADGQHGAYYSLVHPAETGKWLRTNHPTLLPPGWRG